LNLGVLIPGFPVGSYEWTLSWTSDGELVVAGTSWSFGAGWSDAYVLKLDDVYCQPSLGFAGPGASVLTAGGDPLALGLSSDARISGAPANAPVLVGAGFFAGSIAFAGGTLVPVPAQAVLALLADASGTVLIPGIPGGGPATLYAQAVVVDPAQAAGFQVTNALALELSP
jgi:hypothetical protein